MSDIDRPRRRSSRRALLRTAGLLTAGLVSLGRVGAHASNQTASGNPAAGKSELKPVAETYKTQAKGIRILPGQWRPHYPWEHIAWVSPSWPSQDYIWLDFPEAIFTSQGLLFLSHINPPFPTVFSDLPQTPWRQIDGGIAFERELPNGMAFGGAVTKGAERSVTLELYLRNGSTEKLAGITLQTCAYLRAIKEFADYTNDNKYVHLPNEGWISLTKALNHEPGPGKYRIGWRTSGKLMADLPVVATVSSEADRLVALSWGEHTLSIVGNPNHPCVHADPQFPDLAPGETGRIHGRIAFFEGKLDSFHPQDHFDLGT
ncbi:MAG: hypothetical protein HZB26_18455 [Candidatus Hydrogenedentes bacterium]|nr:hypothetical protein [Candidatus Hydrogenedentota bacterium]